ncbi:Serine/threonine-protein kinase KIC1 [Podospora conica]|nr:Serine/threonine-protein kinase KIC1 [Schizothecium conicum]
MADEYEPGADEDGADQRTPPSFILAPLNSAARKVTDHVRNDYRRCLIDENTNTFGLWLDFSDPEIPSITLGRQNTDIYLPEVKSSKGSSQISDLQASFEVVPTTGAVILRDHSEHANTEPFSSTHGSSANHGGLTIKFPSGHRSVLVARGINSRIAFGRDKYYQFEIRWESDGLYSFPKEEPYTVGPRDSKTKKYIDGGKVGGGAYGTVWWAVDITNGTIIAVKKFHSLSGKRLEFATREVANMFRINKSKSIHHDHILQILDSAGGGKNDDWGEIMMPLKDGNLKRLVESLEVTDPAAIPAIAETVLLQMLLALQCMAAHDIIHRDIKPENILWECDSNGEYQFCLGDFGLSNDPRYANTVAGTEPFMAPEVFLRQSQSTKVDIWSLFATYVWINNTERFRHACPRYGASDIHEWLTRIARLPEYARTRRMASRNPKKRPSAEQQLALLAEGEGEYGYAAEYDDGTDDAGADQLGDQFSRMDLREDSGIGYGPDSTDSVNLPERPYYEPYTTGLYPPDEDDEDDENEGQGGQCREYMPRKRDDDDPGAGSIQIPRGQLQAYVATYGEAYGPLDGHGSDTAGPDMWTAQQPTEVEPVSKDGRSHREKESKRKYKDKGKRRG